METEVSKVVAVFLEASRVLKNPFSGITSF